MQVRGSSALVIRPLHMHVCTCRRVHVSMAALQPLKTRGCSIARFSFDAVGAPVVSGAIAESIFHTPATCRTALRPSSLDRVNCQQIYYKCRLIITKVTCGIGTTK